MIVTYRGHYNITGDITPKVETLITKTFLELMEKVGINPMCPIEEQLEKFEKRNN